MPEILHVSHFAQYTHLIFPHTIGLLCRASNVRTHECEYFEQLFPEYVTDWQITIVQKIRRLIYRIIIAGAKLYHINRQRHQIKYQQIWITQSKDWGVETWVKEYQ
jgi:hypothetical protein